VEVFQTRVDSCLTNHEPFRSARVVDPFLLSPVRQRRLSSCGQSWRKCVDLGRSSLTSSSRFCEKPDFVLFRIFDGPILSVCAHTGSGLSLYSKLEGGLGIGDRVRIEPSCERRGRSDVFMLFIPFRDYSSSNSG